MQRLFPSQRRFSTLLFAGIHSLGLTWTPVLVLGTAAVKTMLLPLQITVTRRQISHLRISPLLLAGISPQERIDLYTKFKCSPVKTLALSLAQIPVYIMTSIAIRNTCIEHHEMASDGMLWLTNLCVPDPTLITPVAITLLHLANSIYFQLRSTDTQTHMFSTARLMVLFSRFMCVFAGTVSIFVPAAVNVYWITSALYTLVYNIIRWHLWKV